MIKTIKLRICPNQNQQIQIRKTIGCSRKIYNLMLAERNEVYDRLKDDKDTLYDYMYKTEKQYKQEFPYLKEADSIALQASREYLQLAFSNFFNGLKQGRKNGFPKFKSKKGKQTYTTKQTNKNIKIDFKKRNLKLPKLGWISYRDKRIFNERIKLATVSRTNINTYYVALTLEPQEDVKLKTTIHENNIVAFDMSAKNFLVNEVFKLKNPKFYRTEELKIKLLSKRFSRKQKGSKNQEKARLKLAKHYEKISNRKKDWTHKLT